ncbi:DNA excision repair protein ERCC-6-like, partial [Scleropages formosus]
YTRHCRMAESPEYQHYGGALVEKVAERMQRSLTVDSDETEKYHGIKMIQQAVEEIEQQTSESEDEEFVNVNNSGLMLFKELHEKLYEHQKEGIAFLYGLHRDGRKGGILADDMGLGKTIQIIGFLSGMYDAELIKHTLLVMPTSLIGNWTKEFAKWTPGMRVKEFHGSSKTERNRNLEKIQRRGGVVITTYQMLINNWDLLSSYNGQEFKWDYVILDEAHKIKTSSTKTSKSAHAIPAKHRILLTGTPVQNNLREMWALFDFACQGSLLGTSKTFKAEYENPITRAREKDATPGERALGLKISENLMSIISPYFLRRTKQEVQNKKETENVNSGNSNLEDKENRNPNSGDVEMPSLTRKNDFIVWTYLSAVQEDIYNQFISLDHIKELLMTTRSPLAQLNILKKLCDHPRLLSARAVAQLGLQEGIIPDQENDDENESAACRIDNISDEILVSESGKLTFLVALLERLREEGCRTLVFSQSRKMLDIIDRVLVNRGFKILRIDGTVIHLQERERRIDLFQKKKDYSVFLLTTQVGGVGLTLTAANRVVIFDPSWNPATDAQAVDRAYRIGQKENVVIYRLITCATVEEKIYRRQVFKDSLIRQTTGDKKNPFRYFSQQELKELFKLENTRSSSTQLQLQSMHSKHRRTDPELDEHLAYLHTMEMFGISDHDLMFSQDTALHEDCPEDEESHVYIENRVQKAHELMKAESELHKQFVDNIATSTEPAHLRKSDPSRTHGKPVKAELTFPVVISSSENEGCSSVVDLTQSISDNEEHAQNISPKTTFMKVEPTSPTVGTSTLNFSHTGSNTEEQVQNVSMKLTDLVLIDDNAEEDSAELKVAKEGEITKKNSTSSFNQSLGTSTDKINVFDTSVQEVENSMSFSIVHEDAHEKDKEDAVADFRNKFSSANLESIEEPPKPQSLSLCDSPTMDERVPLVKSVNLRLSGLQKLDYELDCFADESLKSDSNAESLQGNFNLQLEDSDYGECPENKASALDETGHGVHLQGETSLEEKGQSPRTAQVISDSDNDDSTVDKKEDNEVVVSSAFIEPFEQEGPSTPRHERILACSTPNRKSFGGNTSVASRRSFIDAVMDDVEDLDEELEEEQASDYSTSEAEMMGSTRESVMEEEEPSGETLNTDNEAEENGSELHSTESEVDEVESVLEESTGDVELASDEMMEQCTREYEPSQSTRGNPTVISRMLYSQEKDYENFVKRGKEYYSEGKLKEALEFFIKALDIKSGDPQIQLMTIQLYRQLSQN